MIFVVTHRSPLLFWEQMEYSRGRTVEVMKTAYTTKTTEVDADSLEEAVEVAESCWGNSLKSVKHKEMLDK